MSEQEIPEQDMPGPTVPTPHHAWLHHLVGEWKTEPAPNEDGTPDEFSGSGHESYKMFGDLWVLGEGEITFPDGSQMLSRMGLGYDVSYSEYRAFWVATVSSHLWMYSCELSDDHKILTMNCEGPDMMGDAPSALYRDIIELIDADHRTHTSTMQDKDGNWTQYMKNYYTRVK
jgi:hypothetical protein